MQKSWWLWIFGGCVGCFLAIGRLTAQAQPGWQNLRERQLIIRHEAPLWVDSLPFSQSSVQVWLVSAKTTLPASRYTIRPPFLIWQPDQAPAPGTLILLRYRILAPTITIPLSRQKTYLPDSTAADILIGTPYRQPLILANTEPSFRRLDYSGSFTRGLSFGNRQDLVLNANFNLQLAGELAEGVEILASISDENLPLQAAGNTQQLREFDKVFVQLKKGKQQLTAGDYELRHPQGYFLQYFKKLQGVTAQTQTDLGQERQLVSSASVAISRGQFHRQLIEPIEGNQGPYRLRGSRGERFIVVLAGTERVFLQGQLLQRGLEQDYIIDYNRGEVTFTNRQLITRESRIVVEFEYAEQQYLRTLTALSTSFETPTSRLYLNWYAQQDSRTPTALLQLSDTDRAILRAAGDDLSKAILPGAQQLEAFDPSRSMYERRDTLLPCGRRDTIFLYSTDPAKAQYTVRFSLVGPGMGNYQLDAALATNERAYRWVPPDPVTCQPRGDYAPVLPLTPPQQQQFIALGYQWSPNPDTHWETEWALSRFDRNRFSSVDQADDQDWAAFTRFQKKFTLIPEQWSLHTQLSLEHTQRHFQAINPYRNPEFLRDWSLADFQGSGTTEPAREDLIRAAWELRHRDNARLGYLFSAFLREDQYRGFRQEINLDWQSQQWKITGSSSWLQANTEQEMRFFLRPNLQLERRLGKWLLRIESEGERNARRLSGNTLNPSSFAYYRYGAQVTSPEKLTWQGKLSYFNRADFAPDSSDFQAATRAQNWQLTGSWQSGKTLRLDGNFHYRQLERLAAGSASQKTGNTFLGRADAAINLLRGALRNTTTYELGSGQEPRLEFTYIRVAPGEGTYIWQDSLYNNDGVIQANEMEIAPFTDLADYVRVAAVTDDFIPANYVSLNQSWQIEPKAIWFTYKKGLKAWLSRTALQSSWKINRKTQATTAGLDGNPFALNTLDTNLLAVSANLRHVLFINRGNRHWEMQLGQSDNRSKFVLTTGFESRQQQEWFGQLRLNLAKVWSSQLQTAIGERLYDSEVFDQKDFQIRYWKLEPQFTWLPSPRLRAVLGWRWQDDRNQIGAHERARTSDLNGEITFNPIANTSLRSRLAWVQINFEGQPNAPVGFALLNGLQPGRNWLWTLSLDRQIARNLQLRFSYEGRKTSTGPLIHIGRAQISAIF